MVGPDNIRLFEPPCPTCPRTDAEAVDNNFAGALVVRDWLFGTMYLPADRRPREFGVLCGRMPTGLLGLLAHPFRALGRGR